MDKLFYLTSRYGDTGTNVNFHNKNGCGYGTNLDNLELFTLEKAQKELNHDVNSLPLLKTEVDKASIWVVDCQRLDSTKDTFSSDVAAIQIEGKWDGNDIAFACLGGHTFNFSNANLFTIDEANDLVSKIPNSKVWSVIYLNKIKRRTFQRDNINTRKMITGPGIKYKKPRKKKLSSGKVRVNCPSCGRINWQYSPYDFDVCSNRLCELYEWR